MTWSVLTRLQVRMQMSAIFTPDFSLRFPSQHSCKKSVTTRFYSCSLSFLLYVLLRQCCSIVLGVRKQKISWSERHLQRQLEQKATQTPNALVWNQLMQQSDLYSNMTDTHRVLLHQSGMENQHQQEASCWVASFRINRPQKQLPAITSDNRSEPAQTDAARQSRTYFIQ